MNFIQLNSKKQPLTKIEPEFYKTDLSKLENAGIILGKKYIVLDFDGDNDNENKIMEYIEKNFPTLVVKTNRGKHFYYKMPKDYVFKKKVKCISVLGFMCDYLTGEKVFATIKQNGVIREMNRSLSLDNLPELPSVLYPLYKTKDNLSGFIEGDARNSNLFKHLLFVKESYPELDLQLVANTINNYIFSEKLKYKELNSIVKSVLKRKTKNIKNEYKIDKIKYSSVKDLQEKDLPPITFYVDNLIPQGLTLICSLPKIGKSFMALDLCLSIAKGTPFLGYKTTKANCLYLALEDSENRLQDRLNKILNGDIAPDNFIYSTNCSDIEKGLIDQLEDILKDMPDLKIIVIDTLQKIRSNYKGNNNYANDYSEIGKLKEFADKHKLGIILIHHLKKGNENDVFNKISGTNGISGVADTTLVLNKKERNDLNTILSIVGRDVEFNEFIIQFDKNIYKWKMVASYEEQKERDLKNMYDTSPLVDTIKTLVTEHNGKWAGSLKDIEIKQKELYSSLIENKVNKSDLNHIIPLLEKYDNIIYWENTYPIKGKRLKNFCKKKSVESVENVDK